MSAATAGVSVLNREPMGMKHTNSRANRLRLSSVSVLNREPMGMKRQMPTEANPHIARFSAQPRADGDEAYNVRFLSVPGISFSAQPRADGDEAVYAVD